MATSYPKDDLTGKQFNDFTAHEFVGRNSRRVALWHCSCVCGAERIMAGNVLKSLRNKSCGCRPRPKRTHGMCDAPEYQAWSNLKKRCYNPRDKRYPQYGARGITVCDRWLSNFAAFYSDMGPRPAGRYTIERKDNNGNYEPSNCKWATYKEQAQNKSTNHPVTLNGETKCLTEWIRLLDIGASVVKRRIKRGWTAERALTAPTYQSRLLHYDNRDQATADWARELGLKPKTIFERLRKGWTVERALSTPAVVGRNQYK